MKENCVIEFENVCKIYDLKRKKIIKMLLIIK